MQRDVRFGRRTGLEAARSRSGGDPSDRPLGRDPQRDAAFATFTASTGDAGVRVLAAVAPIAQSVRATEAAASIGPRQCRGAATGADSAVDAGDGTSRMPASWASVPRWRKPARIARAYSTRAGYPWRCVDENPCIGLCLDSFGDVNRIVWTAQYHRWLARAADGDDVVGDLDDGGWIVRGDHFRSGQRADFGRRRSRPHRQCAPPDAAPTTRDARRSVNHTVFRRCPR